MFEIVGLILRDPSLEHTPMRSNIGMSLRQHLKCVLRFSLVPVVSLKSNTSAFKASHSFILCFSLVECDSAHSAVLFHESGSKIIRSKTVESFSPDRYTTKGQTPFQGWRRAI